MKRRLHRILVVWLLALLAPWAGPAQSTEPLRGLLPCHALCPAVADPAAYDTSYKRLFLHLVDGHDGWLFRSNTELSETFGPEPEGFAEIARLARALKARGVRLMLVYVPTRGLMHHHRLPADYPYDPQRAIADYARVLEQFRRAGLLVPDYASLVRDGEEIENFYFRRDHHWTPVGARRVAAVVDSFMRQQPWFTSLPTRAFTTEVSGLIGSPGTLARAATQICDIHYPDQYTRGYRTFPTEAASSEDLLFGDTGGPPIVLVGTSFSKGATDYNFAGFLSELLSVEVANEAVAGGSFSGAMDQYLHSESYRSDRPQLLIWEVPAYHTLGDRDFYQRMVPAALGGCGDDALISRTTTIEDGTTELLANATDGRILPLDGASHLLEIQFDAPTLREFELRFWYVNGRSKDVRLKRSERIENSGRFYVELPRGEFWSDRVFLSVNLMNLPETGVDQIVGRRVTTRICRHPELALSESTALR